MNRLLTSPASGRRISVALLCLTALTASIHTARAYTPGFFSDLSAQINGDIATLTEHEEPTRANRLLLKVLQRGSNGLTKTSLADGRMLRGLNTLLGKKENYAPHMGTIASNLLVTFNAEYDFLEGLIVQLPDTAQARAVAAQYQKFGSTAARLNATTKIAKFTLRYDPAKRKLDDLVARASDALLIPFPSDLSPNSVKARVNSQVIDVSAGDATDNVFSAVATEHGVTVTISALLISQNGAHPRGILFSIPDGQLGTFRYEIPTAAVFTNRTEVYSSDESNVAATSGAIFMSVNTNATEVFGTFSCSGPGFEITGGRFRITISSQP